MGALGERLIEPGERGICFAKRCVDKRNAIVLLSFSPGLAGPAAHETLLFYGVVGTKVDFHLVRLSPLLSWTRVLGVPQIVAAGLQTRARMWPWRGPASTGSRCGISWMTGTCRIRRPQEMRSLMRTRKQLVREQSSHVLRVQKTLEDANIKLDSVLSDLMGKSGRAMLEALIAGETNPTKLAG